MKTILTVAAKADLLRALDGAKGGETIRLAPGDYGTLELAARTKINLSYRSEVTITSADPDHPAVFSGLNMTGVKNLTFDGLRFDYTAASGAPINARPFQISNSSDVTVRDSVFDGDVARGVDKVSDGYGTGFALSVRGSENIKIENNEAFSFLRGFVFDGTDDIEVTGNNLHSLRMDGMNFAAVRDVLIAENHIHDFARAPGSGDHCDMIQFWTNGTTRATRDVVIRDNILDIGAGDPTQSIFMRNEEVDMGRAGSKMFYRDITIEGNVITNGHSHGITVGETAGLVIRNNSVLRADGGGDGARSAVDIPKITVSAASTEVTISRNATAAIVGHADQSDWTVRKNALVQDHNPLAPGYYGDVFVTSSRDGSGGAHMFVPLPGGLLDKLGAGAGAASVADVGPLFHVTGPQISNHIKTFDAGIMGPQPKGTAYLWDFGDGTTGSGVTATHAYATGGRYDVTLTLRGPDGAAASTTLPLAVAGADVVRLGSDGFAVFVAGAQTVLAPSPAMGGDGVQLGAKGIVASVARGHVTPLLATSEVTVTLALTADKAGTSGEVARLHGSFLIEVNKAGDVVVSAWSTTGQAVKLVAAGQAVNDRGEHDIALHLSGGTLSLVVDGAPGPSAAFAGTFADSGTHALTFGNPWGKPNFHGDLGDFAIRLNGDAGFGDTPPADHGPDLAPDLVRFDGSGRFEVCTEGEKSLLDPCEAADAGALQLGAVGVSASVARAHVAPLFGAAQATVSMTLAADVAGTTGEVARLHNAFVVSVLKDGAVLVQANSAEGQAIRLTSTGVSVNDSAAHDIDLRVAGGRIELWVDGARADGAGFGGGFADVGRHDLAFGNAWGKANFNGDVSAFSIGLATEGEGALARRAMAPETAMILSDAAPDLTGFDASTLFPEAPDPVGGWDAGQGSGDIFSMMFTLDSHPPLM